jgi:hypothetical protein
VLFPGLHWQFLNPIMLSFGPQVTDLVFPLFAVVGCQHAVVHSSAAPTPHLGKVLLSASMAEGLPRNQW